MLMDTGTEELGHIQMLATAVALNLEGSSAAVQEEAARANPMVAAILGGMEPRQYLSAGMAALAADANGVPFNGSHVYASGNIVADMYSNVAAEATGRALACRLFDMTDDPGMKDMLRYLIARDTMHQQQWLTVIEELGGHQANLPIPDSFDQSQELLDVSYDFFATGIDGTETPAGRWTSGPSLDGKGEYRVRRAVPFGDEPKLAPPSPSGYAQRQQMTADEADTPVTVMTTGDTQS